MSMIEVGKRVGVSHATVSRVINGQPGVSEATARKVRQAMEAVGYVPRHCSRRAVRNGESSKGPRTGHVAVVLLDEDLLLHAHFIHALFCGVELAAGGEGVLASMHWVSDAKQVATLLKESRPDGVLLVARQPPRDVLRAFSGLPVVWLTSSDRANVDAVLPGNEAVGRMAAEYLLERGHRHSAFLSAENEVLAYRLRGEVFHRTVESRGASVELLVAECRRPARSVKTIFRIEEGLAGLVDRLLELRPRPTGLFVPSDLMTSLIYRLLRRRGVAPDREIQIVSCDNEEPYLAGLDPRPATIDIGCHSRGQRAVEQLLWRIHHPEQKRAVQLTIEPILVEPELTELPWGSCLAQDPSNTGG